MTSAMMLLDRQTNTVLRLGQRPSMREPRLVRHVTPRLHKTLLIDVPPLNTQASRVAGCYPTAASSQPRT
jgi:hypothetical protein